MPTAKLPINLGANAAIDEVGLSTHGATLVDGYVDSLGIVNKRPGLSSLLDFGTDRPVDGIFYWDRERAVVAVSNGNIYKITDSNGTYTNVTGDTLSVGNKVIFANYGSALYMANGGRIVKLGTTGTTAYLSDPDAPYDVSHVAVLDKYLIANDEDSETLYFSNVGTPDDWDGDFASAEARPDYNVALGVSDLELMLLGESTLEVWRDDGSTPFIREMQGFVQSGSVAAQSFQFCADFWMWLDENSRVVRLNGRTAEPVSNTLNKYVQTFGSTEDAEAEFMLVGGHPFYILQFPTEDKTIAVDLQNFSWAEWAHWDLTTAMYQRYLGRCSCYAPIWGLSLVGDRQNGIVYMANDSYADDNSSMIRTLIRTPHINHESMSRRKRSRKLTFWFKKTQDVAVASTPNFIVRWRDNGRTMWQREINVSLDPVGQTSFRGTINRMGMYYSRQYEILMLDSTPLGLVFVEEDFDYV